MKTIPQLGSTAVEWAVHAERNRIKVISITVSTEGARILLSTPPTGLDLSAAIGRRVGRGIHWDLLVEPDIYYTWIEGGEDVTISWVDR